MCVDVYLYTDWCVVDPRQHLCEVGCESQGAGRRGWDDTSLHQQRSEALSVSR